MKAIAFAIICAAYTVIPHSEMDRWSDATRIVHTIVFLICILGFWINIMFEDDKK